jgi:Methyltransferase domain
VLRSLFRRLSPRVSSPPAEVPPYACAGIDWNEPAIASGLEVLERYEAEYASFPEQPGGPDARYHHANPFFSLVDAAVAHSFVRDKRFSRIVEVGSGFSSRVLRSALDLNGSGHLLCIDPSPRAPLAGIAHEHRALPVQKVPLSFFAELPPDSLLFIDSSHQAAQGSDVTFLLLSVLPILPGGVVVHVHDIFLPEDYPLAWHDWGYSEQYVLQALLSYSSAFSVLWPGRYVTRTRPREMELFFPQSLLGLHCSFWLQRT